MSIATRIDSDTIEMENRHSSRMTRMRADDRAAMANRNADEQNHRRREVKRQNTALIEQCTQLKEELDEANAIINFWANGSEAFRRTMHHLRENWTPKPGAETDLDKIVDAKHAETRNDPNWVAKRDTITTQQRDKVRERKRTRRPG